MDFPETHWSVLARASLDGGPAAEEALERFCRSYRPAVLDFIRWTGVPAQDAEEVAQEFFLRLLASRAWRRAEPTQGRFRSFLLGALKHHIADLRRRGSAGKRGGGQLPVSLDELMESGMEFVPGIPDDAADQFDRDWAVRIVENALGAVALEARDSGRAAAFERLVPFLPVATDPPSYEALAESLGMSVPAAKSEVHRLRARFRNALRAEVARTVSAPHEIDIEMRHLHSVLAGAGFRNPGSGETRGR